MNVKERYDEAKKVYAEIGVDTDKALETLQNVAISMHCWQGDDVIGFDPVSYTHLAPLPREGAV